MSFVSEPVVMRVECVPVAVTVKLLQQGDQIGLFRSVSHRSAAPFKMSWVALTAVTLRTQSSLFLQEHIMRWSVLGRFFSKSTPRVTTLRRSPRMLFEYLLSGVTICRLSTVAGQ